MLIKYSKFPKAHETGGKLFLDFNGKQTLVISDEQFSAENVIKQMDKGKIDISLISCNIPDPCMLPEEYVAEACTIINDDVAEIIEANKERFHGIAFIPWTIPDAALAEINRTKEMGYKGVMLFSHNGGKMVDDPSMEPLYARCAELGLPILIHPTIPTWYEHVGDYGMIAVMSFVVDTSFALMRLIRSGIIERYPDMKLVMPHAGGVLPYLDGRISYQPKPMRQGLPSGNSRPASEHLRKGNIWYDTANPSAEILAFFRKYTDIGKIMFGTDYPFIEQDYLVDIVNRLGFTSEELEYVYWKNANKLFNLGL